MNELSEKLHRAYMPVDLHRKLLIRKAGSAKPVKLETLVLDLVAKGLRRWEKEGKALTFKRFRPKPKKGDAPITEESTYILVTIPGALHSCLLDIKRGIKAGEYPKENGGAIGISDIFRAFMHEGEK